jgi:hypothetical protein
VVSTCNDQAGGDGAFGRHRRRVFLGGQLMRHQLLFIVAVFLGCGQGAGSAGKCRHNQLLVTAPAGVWIANIMVSGTSCSTASCLRRGPGDSCGGYLVKLTAAGTCDVTLTRSDGSTYTETVAVELRGPGGDCAAEFYPDRDLTVTAGGMVDADAGSIPG